MKIVLVQHTGSGAAYRLFCALDKQNVHVDFVVGQKLINDTKIDSFTTNNYKYFIFKLMNTTSNLLCRLYKNKSIFPFSSASIGFNINKMDKVINADIVHLHWIVGGMMSIKSIARLKKINKPIIWTLHDMWAFTGGCHHSLSCKRYKSNCGKCPILKSRNLFDLSWIILVMKLRYFKKMNLTIITPSKWLKDCAMESRLFNGLQIHVIPNSINTDIFKPINKVFAREFFNIDINKKIVLFGAVDTNSPYKGYKYVIKALRKLGNEDYCLNELEVLIFGNTRKRSDLLKLPYKVNNVGYLNDWYTMALLYNCADVFIMPSIAEVLGYTCMESLACGVPVVAFNTGGISDLIKHKRNGYLTKEISINQLSYGIRWVLDNKNYNWLHRNARNSILSNYTEEIVAKKHIELYKGLL